MTARGKTNPIQIKYAEGNNFSQIPTDYAKDHKLKGRRGEPNLNKANRRVILAYSTLRQENKELRKENEALKYTEVSLFIILIYLLYRVSFFFKENLVANLR